MRRIWLRAVSSLITFGSLAGFSLGQTPDAPVARLGNPGTAEAIVTAEPAPAAYVDAPLYGNGRRGCCISVGFEALFLKPHFNSNPGLAITTTTSRTESGLGSSDTRTGIATLNQEFEYDWSVSPRFWIAFENESGLGMRARYFRFEQAAEGLSATPADSGTLGGPAATITTSTSVSDATGSINTVGSSSSTVGGITTLFSTGDAMFANSGLRLDIIDLEVTQSFRGDAWNVLLAGGVRYTYIRQTYNVFHPPVDRTNTVDGVLVDRDSQSDVLQSRQTFSGAGPILGLDILRQLGSSNLSLYGAGRGSVMFGSGRQRRQVSQLFIDDDFDGAGNVIETDVNALSNLTQTRTFDVVSILEIELGVQWNRAMGGRTLFLRPSFVGQMYFDGGNASSRSSDFGMVGGVLTAGVLF